MKRKCFTQQAGLETWSFKAPRSRDRSPAALHRAAAAARNIRSRSTFNRYTDRTDLTHLHARVMTMLVSISDAAFRLTALGDKIDRTTLSRYLKQHAPTLPLTVSGRERLVEFEALLAHRRENIRISTPTLGSIASETPSQEGAIQPAKRFAGSEIDATGRLRMAQARDAELDLAERLKQVTPVAEVDRAGRDAVALMRAAMERAVEAEADRLNLRYGWDARVARLALKDFARVGIDVFHREVMKEIDAMCDHPNDMAVA